MTDFDKQAVAYAQSVERFTHVHRLPSQWFRQPDHIAYKCVDGEQYDQMVAEWQSQAVRATQVELDERRLGTFQLTKSIAVGTFGAVNWLEIMEPRPSKVGKDVIGIDHMEFTFPLFDSVRKVLDKRKITYEDARNPNHAWISIHTPEGHEFKISNKPLGKICEVEIASGKATILAATKTRTFRLDKLVRAGIPDIMRADDQEVGWRQLSDEEKPAALISKVREEADEFMLDPGLAEAADLIQAIKDTLELKGFTWNQILQEINRRHAERGGFTEGVFVETVTVPEASKWVEYYLKHPEKSPEVSEVKE